MRPPAPSTSPATSPTPRRAVPLKSMCSWKCARPSSPGRSSAEPTRAQIWSSATGGEMRLAQQESEAVREDRVVDAGAGSQPAQGSRGAGPVPYRRAGDGSSASTCTCPFCERVCPYCDFAVVAGAVARARARGRATWRRCCASWPRARRPSRARRGSRRSTSAAARRRCCGPRRSRGSSRRRTRRCPSGARPARSRSR